MYCVVLVNLLGEPEHAMVESENPTGVLIRFTGPNDLDTHMGKREAAQLAASSSEDLRDNYKRPQRPTEQSARTANRSGRFSSGWGLGALYAGGVDSTPGRTHGSCDAGKNMQSAAQAAVSSTSRTVLAERRGRGFGPVLRFDG